MIDDGLQYTARNTSLLNGEYSCNEIDKYLNNTRLVKITEENFLDEFDWDFNLSYQETDCGSSIGFPENDDRSSKTSSTELMEVISEKCKSVYEYNYKQPWIDFDFTKKRDTCWGSKLFAIESIIKPPPAKINSPDIPELDICFSQNHTIVSKNPFTLDIQKQSSLLEASRLLKTPTIHLASSDFVLQKYNNCIDESLLIDIREKKSIDMKSLISNTSKKHSSFRNVLLNQGLRSPTADSPLQTPQGSVYNFIDDYEECNLPDMRIIKTIYILGFFIPPIIWIFQYAYLQIALFRLKNNMKMNSIINKIRYWSKIVKLTIATFVFSTIFFCLLLIVVNQNWFTKKSRILSS